MDDCSYSCIAEDYNLKRKKPWIALKQYLELTKFNSIGLSLDLGCANGRNFKLFLEDGSKKLIGIDKTINFLQIAKNQIRNEEYSNKFNINQISFILCDISFLPLRDNIANNIFSGKGILIKGEARVDNNIHEKDIVAKIVNDEVLIRPEYLPRIVDKAVKVIGEQDQPLIPEKHYGLNGVVSRPLSGKRHDIGAFEYPSNILDLMR